MEVSGSMGLVYSPDKDSSADAGDCARATEARESVAKSARKMVLCVFNEGASQKAELTPPMIFEWFGVLMMAARLSDGAAEANQRCFAGRLTLPVRPK
jgi:hypothetical protein